jgi:hypothetical protein
MFDVPLMGDLWVLAILIGTWALAIWFVAAAFEAVRKVVRGY